MFCGVVLASTTDTKPRPRAAHTWARPSAMFPELDSTITVSGPMWPSSIPFRIMASAGRSFELPAGLSASSLPKGRSTPAIGSRLNGTSRVLFVERPVGGGPFTRQQKRERAPRRARLVARRGLAGCVGPREGARDAAEPFGGGAPQDVVVEVDRRLPGKAEHVVLDQGDGE